MKDDMSPRKYITESQSLKKTIFSLEFVPDLLEYEYSRQLFNSYGKRNTLFLIYVGLLSFPSYAALDFLVYGSETYLPMAMSILNFIHSIVSFFWLYFKPGQSKYIIIYLMSSIWLESGCVARSYFPLEEVFIIMSVYYSLTGSPIKIVNLVVFIGVLIRLVFDYYSGMKFFVLWCITVWISYFWSWAISYAAESVSREWFWLSKKKDKEQRALMARQNSRTMFEMETSKGSFKIRKRDILTNEEVEDVDFMGSTTDSSSSGAITPLQETILHEETMDLWLKEAFPAMRAIGTFAVVVHLLMSLMNWYILPAEGRYYLYFYHFYFGVPFCINLISFMFVTNFFRSYNRYLYFLGIVLFFSVATSWVEVIVSSYYDVDGSITQIAIAKLFLILYIRHHFVFLPRSFRITAASFDFVLFTTMLFVGDYWLTLQTVYQMSYVFLVPFMAEVQNTKVWQNVKEIYRYMKLLDILMAEIQKEIVAMDKIKDIYTHSDDSLVDIVDQLKIVKNPERWTPVLSELSLNEMVDVFVNLVKDLGLVDSLKIEMKSFRIHIARILDLYKENPYHNAKHAISVCFVLKYFLEHSGARVYYTDLECLAIMLAGISHDAGHPGTNNAFLIKTQSPLVKRFGAKSTLERFHIYSAKNSLGDWSFLPYIQYEETEKLMKLLKKMIMATDTATFGHTLSTFERHLDNLRSARVTDKEKVALAKVMIICADVSNVAYSTQQSELWLVNLLKEFYLQGDEEDNLGVGISLFMDRKKNAPYTLCCGFIDMVAGKMIKSLSEVLKIEPFINQMENNRLNFGMKKKGENV